MYFFGSTTVFPLIVSALEQFPPLNSFRNFMYCHQRSQYIRSNSKKNSFRRNYSRKYGMQKMDCSAKLESSQTRFAISYGLTRFAWCTKPKKMHTGRQYFHNMLVFRMRMYGKLCIQGVPIQNLITKRQTHTSNLEDAPSFLCSLGVCLNFCQETHKS